MKFRYFVFFLAFSTAQDLVNLEYALGSDAFAIGSRRELFVDDSLIESMQGVRLQLQKPLPAGKILQFDQPWEGITSWTLSIVKDGDHYLLYYIGRSHEDYIKPSALRQGEKVVKAHPTTLCLAKSPDGKTWTKPTLGIHEFNGSKHNNIVAIAPDLPGVPFMDTNPQTPRDKRFKALWGQKTNNGSMGAMISVSEDGLAWKPWRQEPVFTSNLPNAFDSVNLVFWSEHEQQYVCYFRYMKQGIRSFVRTTSKNLLDWTDQVPVDFGNSTTEHYYTNATQPYFRAPHIYLAFPKRFLPFRVKNPHTSLRGISETVFMSTRNGVRFTPFMEAFIRPGRDPRNWVHRTTGATVGLVPTGDDEISIYTSRNYTFPTAHVERFAIRTDGFVSIHADYQGGQFVTRPLLFKGNSLFLNYATSAAGNIQIEILNADGSPFPGYRLEESPIIYGDEINGRVEWNRPFGKTDSNPLGGISRGPIRLRFVMKDADLYSFWFK